VELLAACRTFSELDTPRYRERAALLAAELGTEVAR
jgi:hypothetical protein